MLGLLYCESLLRWIEIAAISLVNADVVYYPLLSLTSSSIGAAHASRVYAKKVSGGYDLI